MPAPAEAIEYYNLPETAKMRDLFLAVRADEACHREVNHHFSDIPSYAHVESSEIIVKGVSNSEDQARPAAIEAEKSNQDKTVNTAA